MTTIKKDKTKQRRPRLTALIRSLIAFGVGGLVWLLTDDRFLWQTRILLTWLAYTFTALAMVWFTIARFDAQLTARQEDESRPVIFLFTVAGSFISLFAVIALLGSLKGLPPSETTLHAILSTGTVFSSWTLIHSMFTLHYARLYYDPEGSGRKGGLEFPGRESPDYLDFAYYSFVVGMTGQVSDVAVTCRPLRRTTLVHGVLSFAFNALIIAFSINTLSGLI